MDQLWNRLVDIHEAYVIKYRCTLENDSAFRTSREDYEKALHQGCSTPATADAQRTLALVQKEAQKRMASELRELEVRRREEVKIARQNSGLWWGNYNAVVKAFEYGRSATLRAKGTLRKKEGLGPGRLTNQIQGGASVEHLFDGTLSQVNINPVPGEAWSDASRGRRKRLQRTFLHATAFVRDGQRRTVTWPIVLHRPLPPDCRIKEVVVNRRQFAGRWKWTVSFFCTRVSEFISPAPGNRHVTVDIGWRKLEDGLRIATYLSGSEEPVFVVLHNDFLGAYALIGELQAKLVTVLQEGVEIFSSLKVAETLSNCAARIEIFQSLTEKKHVDLIDLIRYLVKQNFFYQINNIEINNWHKSYNKIYLWLKNHQRKTILRRKHLYRNTAVSIVDRAASVTIHDVKLGELAVRRPAESNQAFFPQKARYYRVVAATSDLLRFIEQRCIKCDVPFTRIQLPTPLPCPTCGSIKRQTRADALVQKCLYCNAKWDQDVEACRELARQRALI